LIEKVSLGLDSERFFHCIPTLFDLVGCGVLKLSPRDLGDVFEDCLKKLEGYHLTLKDEVLFAVLHAVRSTVVLWLHPDYEPYRSRVLEVIKHVIQKNETGLIHSWRLRDLVLQIIDEFLPKDTSGVVTPFSLFSNGNAMSVDGAPPLPDFFLAMMHLMNDDDIRVRVRAAPANAKLFFLEDVVQRHPLDFYVDWRKHLPEELDRSVFLK
jgi:ataxia telangiectasia mutated family protein